MFEHMFKHIRVDSNLCLVTRGAPQSHPEDPQRLSTQMPGMYICKMKLQRTTRLLRVSRAQKQVTLFFEIEKLRNSKTHENEHKKETRAAIR